MKAERSYPICTVGGLIIAEDGEMLFVKSPKWCNLYTLPGGKVELGESLQQAFEREIKEETGLEVIEVKFAMVQDSLFSSEFYMPNHFIMHDFTSHLAPQYTKDQVILNEEGTEFKWMLPQEAYKWSLNRELYVLLDWYLRSQKG
jgi:8-oxo-dGTP diphosphatase